MINNIRIFYMVTIGWLPTFFQAFILGFVAVMLIIIIFKIIGLILDAIPFL